MTRKIFTYNAKLPETEAEARLLKFVGERSTRSGKKFIYEINRQSVFDLSALENMLMSIYPNVVSIEVDDNANVDDIVAQLETLRMGGRRRRMSNKRRRNKRRRTNKRR